MQAIPESSFIYKYWQVFPGRREGGRERVGVMLIGKF